MTTLPAPFGRIHRVFLPMAVLLLTGTSVCLASEETMDLPGSMLAAVLPFWWYLAPIGAGAALFMAQKFYKGFMTESEGDENMVRIAQAVRDGAYAYLRSQWKVISIVFVALLVILAILGFQGMQGKITFIGVGVAGFLSGLCGYFGMKTATSASARTTNACKRSLNDGLTVAFRAGAVMGLCVTGFALADISFWYLILTLFSGMEGFSLVTMTTVVLSFAMGASLQALFARVGGGIYTKAADVGADLVGKVEAGIPEDDARNPATIADNVGDNVGDVAGMGADLYESYYGSILAASALAAAAAAAMGLEEGDAMRMVAAPATLAGMGILTSIASIFMVKTKEGASMKDLLKALHGGVWISSGMIVVASFVMLQLFLRGIEGVNPIGIWGSIVSGLVAGLVIAWGTEYYTSYEHKPTQRISGQAETGPATVIIAGIAEGMVSTWIPLITTVVAIMLSYFLAGGAESFLLGAFGVGIAAVGMLSTLAITLATDAYGPIADNAGGNAEMTHQDPSVRERTDLLDSLGNTTAATGKGFAIGSAALTALALLAAYVITVKQYMVQNDMQIMVEGVSMAAADASITQIMNSLNVTLVNPKVLGGVFMGVMLVFVFCAMTMNAVGKAANEMMLEARRQFGKMRDAFRGQGMSDEDMADPTRWPYEVEHEGVRYPDYSSCVEISTKSALRQMVVPAVMAIVIPVLTGLVLGVPGVMGMLVGALTCGFAVAIFMANAGGAWDNAKKYIETGEFGGKGSEPHKATVVGDTVGDPFKDTSGPSLNILIKLMSIVSVVFAGLVVKYSPAIQELLHLSN